MSLVWNTDRDPMEWKTIWVNTLHERIQYLRIWRAKYIKCFLFCWNNFKVRYDETVDLPNTVWFHMSVAKFATGANISANIKEMKHYNKNKISRKLFWYNFKPRIYATRCVCWFFLSVNLHGRIAKREAKRVNLILICSTKIDMMLSMYYYLNG